MDQPAAYTPWQSSSMQAQRWSPHAGPRFDHFPLTRVTDPIHTDNHNVPGLSSSSPGTYSNYTPPAPAARPQPPPQGSDPPPPSASAAITTNSAQEDSQTASSQIPALSADVPLGAMLGIPSTTTPTPSLTTGPSPSYIPAPTYLGSREGQHSMNPTAASSQQNSARLPVPTGHAQHPRPARPRLSSGRSPRPEELRSDVSRNTTEGSGPSTSSSDDDSDAEMGPRVRFLGYQHSTRQSQILRGQLTNKRVASRKAVQSLQEVDMTTLSESERSKLVPRYTAHAEGKHLD